MTNQKHKSNNMSLEIQNKNEDIQKQRYRFRCEDREYKLWNLYDSMSLEKINHEQDNDPFYNFDPIKGKLFNQDTFTYTEDGTVTLIHSSVREMPMIPGVIILDKQYGNYKDKYLYKLCPDDKRLPDFLVPYKVKKMGFQKNQKNIYVTMRFKSWEGKHPIGIIVQNIGDVDILENFYEYQLYCKSLNASIQTFTKEAMNAIKNNSENQYIQKIMENYNVVDRRDKYVISIDPEKSRDIDDAFSFEEFGDYQILSIYIANVSLWMDALELWSSFSNRISTIYLPDRKRPMLPNILSDCLCSLLENQTRFAFTLDIKIKDDKIIETQFLNTSIIVRHNYHYESKSMKNDSIYINAFQTISKMSKKFKYVDIVRDSHSFIAYIMILMNYISAKELMKYKTGIYRSVKLGENDIEHITGDIDLSQEMKTFLIMWNSTGGQYMKYSNVFMSFNSIINQNKTDDAHQDNNKINDDNNSQMKEDNYHELERKVFEQHKTSYKKPKTQTPYMKHDILKLDSYVHVTSPIRRLVDLLNIIELQECIGLLQKSEASNRFFIQWTHDDKIEYINTSMRAIRKLQGDCEFLHMCTTKPEILDEIYSGYVFDRIERKDGLYQYVVYLPKLRMVNRHTTRNLYDNFTTHNFKLYLFNNQFSYKKKILLGYYED